jgi:two-component system sensor histidine kinase AlgZ
MVAPRRPWFPDFCRMPRIAAVLGITELVVVIIALAPTHAQRWSAQEFIAASVFALWLALTLAVTYCKAKPMIDRLPAALAFGAATLLPLVVAAFGAWCVQQIDMGLGLGYTLPAADQWRFVASVAALAVLISALALRYFYVREQWHAQVQAHAKAQVDALQARIRPHFLFNSMNTIASLVRRDPDTAERVVEDLSELFRAALGSERDGSTLAEELHLAERYLAIEALRFGDRLQQRWEIADDIPKALPLPRLILQPLVENAVVHGISRLPNGGEIGVHVAVEGNALCMSVVNPALPPRERDAGNGHAQESIAQRLAYQFGSAAKMTGEYRDGYYRCEVRLPLP